MGVGARVCRLGVKVKGKGLKRERAETLIKAAGPSTEQRQMFSHKEETSRLRYFKGD